MFLLCIGLNKVATNTLSQGAQFDIALGHDTMQEQPTD